MRVLGVRIDNLERKDIFEKIEMFLHGDKFCQIATINPEFVLKAQDDEEFKNILNSCVLNVADGFGINFAFWIQGQKLKYRLTGADLMWKILEMADTKKLSVFLVANRNGLSGWKETAEIIKKIYPNIKISGVDIDYFSGFECDLKKNEIFNCVKSNIFSHEIIFCNFGAPYQEKFIYSLKEGNYVKIKLAVGVGGSFDFISKKIRRAPFWMRKLGLEWFFRLIQQPSRFFRIFKAVVVFPVKIILDKILK